MLIVLVPLMLCFLNEAPADALSSKDAFAASIERAIDQSQPVYKLNQ